MNEEADEVAKLSVDDLSRTTTSTTTTTTTEKPYYPPGLPLLAGWLTLWWMSPCLAIYQHLYHSIAINLQPSVFNVWISPKIFMQGWMKKLLRLPNFLWMTCQEQQPQLQQLLLQPLQQPLQQLPQLPQRHHIIHLESCLFWLVNLWYDKTKYFLFDLTRHTVHQNRTMSILCDFIKIF